MPDSMTIRLHLHRTRVIEVVENLVDRLVVAVGDGSGVVRCRLSTRPIGRIGG